MSLTAVTLQTGMRSFRKGDVTASVEEFDEAMRLDPELRPYLWQRGLSFFYAGSTFAHFVWDDTLRMRGPERLTCNASCCRPHWLSPGDLFPWHYSPKLIDTGIILVPLC